MKIGEENLKTAEQHKGKSKLRSLQETFIENLRQTPCIQRAYSLWIDQPINSQF